jgi:N,N'-diacetyllegionaminate synthase
MMSKTIIIAEAGVNHNGSIELAKKLIDAAAEAGVDYVKFQTFKAEKLVSKSAPKAAYQANNTGDNSTGQFEMLKKLELDENTHLQLIDYCGKKNIKFLSTAFDNDSIDLLKKLGMKLFKIPSGEITNLPYLIKIAEVAQEVVISTGMCNYEEITQALDVFFKKGFDKRNITILHCNTEYPTPMGDVNLRAMLEIAKATGIKTGYSDHTLGIEVPIAAVAMGAVMIEKHFTLNREMEGPDHKASLEPSDLVSMVKAIRNIELALGTGVKKPSPSELKNLEIARKSIHLAKTLPVGHIITENDLEMKRPGNGISPMRIDTVIGKKLVKALKEDSILKPEDFE